MDDNIKIGDWVRSYGSGIWRVHRILELNDFDIQSQTNKPRTVIFSSRFVNDSYKRSFSTESCDSAFVYHLDSNEKEELDAFMGSNPELVAKFDAYKPKSIDAVYNANVNIPASGSQADLEEALSSFQELNLEQLYNQLIESKIGSSVAKGWTAQFVSSNHECLNGKLLYSFSKVLAF
ncbi:hypothetical protein [Pseudoalteromonas luteoviolacea]|uniref:Uncharacterized protein n=1 Tax=Pseudoalteromonas luteoviolacea S4054 TaxID=1129367 RepID=A0A0F6A4I9_9GAMM|nr:hypothetical protein [Pseudoalteromonas luteoviolacea]AOT08756.1 hypothetical protein S4054249_13230 [Pseudoalteromonas luteoviolacea]AOT13670.1 hypothetical protein S40542_13200 [Pseudoalteromonas luteoviolacea]AOT18584.1 hypothetical protein S4054_13205 [Pseudoalteromonas luteoviolacea]KKE80791.1 hypothetical protein N479_24555 [Pseudoalteromonas luteoviolacea S4054]KZN78544.1 hypothetical protein N481_26000 [Pseudoalteromonas luteoviolacea S4047-1]